ncbi:MAG TPA: hypothetical protein VFE38_16315 [Edaphobacter sp.]|nr:hypothetical protein [Edaphobacter sp.]
MKQLLPSPLPRFDHNLLRVVQRLVPGEERDDWSRTWEAELWHLHHRRGVDRVGPCIATSLSVGLTRDALWLRTEYWRRSYTGTPALCLAMLAGLCFFSALISLALSGSWHELVLYLDGPLQRALLETPLVVFVAFAANSQRQVEQGPGTKKLYWMKRQLLLAAKTALVLLLALLLSADVCQPLHASLPNTADVLQIFFFSIFALIGLRWDFRDQEQRCKQCCRSLATPARVGRPSYNLLEWNGTELICKHGHGLLSIPEMETSWCQSSQWIGLDLL